MYMCVYLPKISKIILVAHVRVANVHPCFGIVVEYFKLYLRTLLYILRAGNIFRFFMF